MLILFYINSHFIFIIELTNWLALLPDITFLFQKFSIKKIGYIFICKSILPTTFGLDVLFTTITFKGISVTMITRHNRDCGLNDSKTKRKRKWLGMESRPKVRQEPCWTTREGHTPRKSTHRRNPSWHPMDSHLQRAHIKTLLQLLTKARRNKAYGFHLHKISWQQNDAKIKCNNTIPTYWLRSSINYQNIFAHQEQRAKPQSDAQYILNSWWKKNL